MYPLLMICTLLALQPANALAESEDLKSTGAAEIEQASVLPDESSSRSTRISKTAEPVNITPPSRPEAESADVPLPPLASSAEKSAPQTASAGKALLKGRKFASVPYPLMLDGREQGQVIVRIDSQGNFTLTPSELLNSLGNILTPKAKALLEALPPEPRPPGTFVEGVKAEINPRTQMLEVTLDLDLRQKNAVSISEQSQLPPDAVLAKQAKVSAYLNMFPDFTYVHRTPGGGDTGFQDITAAFDGAMRFFGEKGFVIEGEGSFTESGENAFVREGTRLVYDIPEKLTRFTFGDIDVIGDGFQSGASAGGFSIASSFSLQPSKIFRPLGQRSVQVQRNSEVEIYVNGQKFRTLQLTPGRYDLNDFPLTTGNNNVEIRITDDTGRTERINFDNYQDFAMLAQGVSEFNYQFGVLSTPEGSDIQYSRENPIFSAYHKFGLSQNVTVGANVQGTKDVRMAGISGLFGTPVGLIGGDAAFSDSDINGKGYALTGRYRMQSARGSSESLEAPFSNYTIESAFVYFSPDFVAIDDTPSSTMWSWVPSISTNINQRLSVFTGAQYDRIRDTTATDEGYRTGLTGGLNWNFNDGLSLLAQLRYFNDTSRVGSQEDVTAFFTLSWRPGTRHNLSAGYNTEDRRTSLDYSYSSDNKAGSWGADATLGYATRGDDLADFSGSVNYMANRFQAELRTDTSLADADGSRDATWRSGLRFGTSLAFADGAFAIGRPIANSFAIIDKHKSVGSAKIAVNKDENGHYDARIDRFGAAVVPFIFPFYHTELKLDVADLPLGYDMGKGRYDVVASYKSGYKLSFGSAYNVTVIGQLGEPYASMLGLTAGRIRSKDDPSFEPLLTFTNKTGRFASGGLKPGAYELVFSSEPEYRAEFTVPENDESLVRLKPEDIAVSETKR